MGQRAAALAAVLLALVVLLAARGTSAAAAGQKAKDRTKGSRWRQPPPPPAGPGAHLFKRTAEGHDPLRWDDDDLERIRQLHGRSFSDKGEYLKAASLAEYLGLGRVEEVHVTVPLHIVFIGFLGDGNAKVRLEESALTEWFGHLDHLLPHARIALADLTCAEDGHCAGPVEGSFSPHAGGGNGGTGPAPDPPTPLPSHARLNFSCNVVVVQKAEVLDAYERAISAFSRPTDPDFEQGTQQVDAIKLEPFIDSMLEGLGLDSGYSIVVANPKWSANLAAYGFRAGFSGEEVEMLQAQVPEMRQLSLAHWEGEPTPPRGHAFGGGHHAYLGVWSHRTQKLSVSQLQAESMAWAKSAQAYIAQEEDYRRKLLKAIGPRTKGALSVARAVALLRDRAKSEVGQLLAAMIMMPSEHFVNSKWRAGHPLEDCLTPNWVGRGRWLLLDLTAQKTDWGPALGGEGTVTMTTLPDVAAMFSEMNEQRTARREDRASSSEHETDLRGQLQAKVSGKLAEVQVQHEHERRMRLQGAVHGVGLGQDADDESDMRQQEALLHAELDIYEEFALHHCHNRLNPPVACNDAEEAATEIRHELQSLAGQSTAALRGFREHNWDIFGISDADDSHPDVADAFSRAKEHFLGHLSDILSHGLRHVIAPPSAAWHHEGVPFDSASPYAHRVHFTIYTIADNSRKLSEWRSRGLAFDVDAFKHQVTRLALPHQTFDFASTTVDLLDDPALASGFAVSLRTAFAEVPNAYTQPAEAEIVYADSLELAAALRRRFGQGMHIKGTPTDPHSVLHVPVFIFNLDRDHPILIDEHYNARALEDMVVVVDNAANQDEHPTGFMCEGAVMARPLSPMRHALAAVLQHLGGVLPPHLAYHPRRNLIARDWLWSVGAHPLSWTSTGTAYSQMHIDALHRSYILDALDASVEAVNAGVDLLAAEKPTEAGFKRVTAAQADLRRALQLYSQTVNLWRSAVSQLSNLDFSSAAELISSMDRMAASFKEACEQVEAVLHPQRCAERAPIAPALLKWLVIGSGSAVALTLLLTCGLPRKKAKAG